MSGKRRYKDHKREKGIKKQGKNTTGEKRVRLCEYRRARSQTTSPLYIQPEQLETHDHRREKEKITLPHYSNHFLENEARRSPSLSPYLFSSLSSLCTAVFAFTLSFCEDKPSGKRCHYRPSFAPPAGLNDSPRSVTPLVSLSITLPNPSGIDTPIDCRMLSTHPTSCGREEEEGGRGGEGPFGWRHSIAPFLEIGLGNEAARNNSSLSLCSGVLAELGTGERSDRRMRCVLRPGSG